MTPENNNTVTQREHPAFEDDYNRCAVVAPFVSTAFI